MSTTPGEASMVPAPTQVLELLMGKVISQSIVTAAKFNIADHLAAGSLGIAELAERAEANEFALLVLMRALASVGIFEEVGDARFANSRLSETLRAKGPASVRALALFLADRPTWLATGDLDYTVRTGKPAFEKIHGLPPYDYFAKHVTDCGYYDEAFTNFSNQETDAILHAAAFPDTGTFVDVGGGLGTTLCRILQKNEKQRGILFDQKHVVERAGQLIESFGVSDRCTVVPGNFFERVPEGGDAYLIKHVLFNWDDERATKILKAVRRAIQLSSRLFVIDPVMRRGPGQTFVHFMGVDMMVLHAGGRQRTVDEFSDLLAGAGFKLLRVVDTPAPSSIIEAVPV